MRRFRRACPPTLPRSARVWLAAALALGLGLPPAVASASPDTLRMAIEDVTMGAADVVASPVTGGIATARNMDAVSDDRVLQGAYVLPGWLGLTFLQAAQGVLRVTVGALQMIPGIVLFPFPDTDVPESFNVFRRGEALVDVRNPLGERPPWLAYVLPITPITIDARVAPISPWAVYGDPGTSEDPGPGEGASMADMADGR